MPSARSLADRERRMKWPRKWEMKFGVGMSFWPLWWRLQFRPESELDRSASEGFSWHIGPFCLWANWK